MTTTTTTTWHDTAADGFFGPMSPDTWPDGPDDFHHVLSSLAGSDRAFSKSPNSASSLNSQYSPINPLLPNHNYRVLPNVHLQTNALPDGADSASNSPASVPVHTPPEMNASIDQMLEMNPALWSQSSPGLDQSWEMVPRQPSIASLDSPIAASQASFDRITDFYPIMSHEPAMPVQQQDAAFHAAHQFQFPIHQGSSASCVLKCVPKLTVAQVPRRTLCHPLPPKTACRS